MEHKIFISGLDMRNTLGSERQNTITVATLLQAHPGGWALECLGPNVPLELEPTRGGAYNSMWTVSRILDPRV